MYCSFHPAVHMIWHCCRRCVSCWSTCVTQRCTSSLEWLLQGAFSSMDLLAVERPCWPRLWLGWVYINSYFLKPKMPTNKRNRTLLYHVCGTVAVASHRGQVGRPAHWLRIHSLTRSANFPARNKSSVYFGHLWNEKMCCVFQELQLPMLKVSAPELVSGVSGESEQKLRELFDLALVSSIFFLIILYKCCYQ